MPADHPGVTTDDQGLQGTGGDSTPTTARPNGGGAAGDATPEPGVTPPDTPVGDAHPPTGERSRPATPSGSELVPPAPSLDPRPDRGLVTPEPPPAPVLAPTGPAPAGRTDLLGAARRRVRGRHASGRPSRADRASRRGLRVDQRLWSLDPWSVFKLSALFYFCLGLIIIVAGTLLYNAGRSVGTIDQFESFVTRMGAYGECVPTAEVPEGTTFEEDEDKCDEGEVLVGGFTLDDGLLFRAAAIGGTILVVAGSIGNVLLTVLLNLLNEVTGGLRHTVIREPVRQPQGGGQGRGAPGPGAVAPRRSGSPRRPPQG